MGSHGGPWEPEGSTVAGMPSFFAKLRRIRSFPHPSPLPKGEGEEPGDNGIIRHYYKKHL